MNPARDARPGAVPARQCLARREFSVGNNRVPLAAAAVHHVARGRGACATDSRGMQHARCGTSVDSRTTQTHATNRQSAVRKLIQPQAPLQRQSADGIMAVTFLMTAEAGPFDQKSRRSQHSVAAQAQTAMFERQHRIVSKFAGGGEDCDAIGFRRVQHCLDPRKRRLHAPWAGPTHNPASLRASA